MPAANISQRHTNLVRLRDSLSTHCPVDNENLASARDLATNIPLTHATSRGKLTTILGDDALLSQEQSGSQIGEAETLLETANDVFLYVGSFSYPETECGFLFEQSVEDEHQDDGIATPFDSGALAKKISPPSPYDDGVAFVRDHELPVAGYRELLADVISGFLPSPENYLRQPDAHTCRCGTTVAHPFGLKGGDCRTATFEVRIPERVPLRTPHLRAVFVREGYEAPELSELFAAGVTIVNYPAPDDGDFFNALKKSCINFIHEHLIP